MTQFAAYWCGSIGPTAPTPAEAADAFFTTYPHRNEAIIRPVDFTDRFGVPHFVDGRGTYVQRLLGPSCRLRRVK